MERRNFLSTIGAAVCFTSAVRACRAADEDQAFVTLSLDEKAQYEPYWPTVADAFDIERDYSVVKDTIRLRLARDGLNVREVKSNELR